MRWDSSAWELWVTEPFRQMLKNIELQFRHHAVRLNPIGFALVAWILPEISNWLRPDVARLSVVMMSVVIVFRSMAA